MSFSTLEDVRNRIDQIDSELVKIIAQRAECVKAAAAFKTDHSAVRAPDRVQQVIDKVRKKAAKAEKSLTARASIPFSCFQVSKRCRHGK